MAAPSSGASRLGDGALLALAILFAVVAAVFALGLVYGILNADPMLLVAQSVITLAVATLDVRLWRLWRERRRDGGQARARRP